MPTTKTVRAGVIGALALAAAAPDALAQPVTFTITRLYRDGDLISTPAGDPIGLVTGFAGVAVNNAGTTLVEIDTDHTPTTADSVVMRAGVLMVREDDVIAGTPGYAISSIDSVNLNASGNVAWNLFLRNTGATNNDSGLFFNSTLVLQEGTISASPVFSPNTPYIGFFEARGDDQNNFMVMASVDDPAIATTVDRAIVVFDYDPMSNTYVENVLAKEGDTLPGMPGPVTDFGTSPENMSRSANGMFTMFIATVSGGAADTIYVNATPVAQEGQPSPLAGRVWRIVTSAPLDVNNAGGYAFRATLDGDAGTDVVIVRNGTEVIAQEGDPVPGVPGFELTSFGSGPLFIDDAGNVTWFGDWNDPDTTRDRGLFRNDQLLLQEGVTLVDGEVVTEVLAVSEGYGQSPDGRHTIIRVRLAAGGDAVILLSITPPGCVADVDDGSGSGTPDGGVTIDDLLYYIEIFEDGSVDADVDNGSGTGTPDGGVTIDDLLYYLFRFEAGC